jgi:hypothetical protein
MNCGYPIPNYRTQKAQESAEDAKGIHYFFDLVSVFFCAFCVLLRLLRPVFGFCILNFMKV